MENIPSEFTLVTKEMAMGEIVAKYPQAVQIVQSVGLHCAGCMVSYIETLEQGCLGHGMSEDEIDDLVKRINQSIQHPVKEDSNPIKVSNSASVKLREILNEDGKTDWFYRILVVNITVPPYISFELDFAFKPLENDIIFTANEINFIIDKSIVEKVQGAIIDFDGSKDGVGFSIKNPKLILKQDSSGFISGI